MDRNDSLKFVNTNRPCTPFNTSFLPSSDVCITTFFADITTNSPANITETCIIASLNRLWFLSLINYLATALVSNFRVTPHSQCPSVIEKKKQKNQKHHHQNTHNWTKRHRQQQQYHNIKMISAVTTALIWYVCHVPLSKCSWWRSFCSFSRTRPLWMLMVCLLAHAPFSPITLTTKWPVQLHNELFGWPRKKLNKSLRLLVMTTQKEVQHKKLCISGATPSMHK